MVGEKDPRRVEAQSELPNPALLGLSQFQKLPGRVPGRGENGAHASWRVSETNAGLPPGQVQRRKLRPLLVVRRPEALWSPRLGRGAGLSSSLRSCILR